jgi:hypothetical protein
VESEASFCLEGIEKAENHEIARQIARQNATFKLAAPSSSPAATVSPARSDKSDRLLGSPAIDKGDPDFENVIYGRNDIYDQRGPGFPRLSGLHMDIGAFEAQP